MTPEYLADRIEIDDLITRYAVAIDTKQFDLLDTVFTPDAYIDYAQSAGKTGHFPEMKRWMAAVMEPFAMTQHVIANRDVKLDGDTALARCYLYNPLGVSDEDGGLDLFFVGGYYTDRCVRTPDGWRIAARVSENVWLNGTVPETIVERSQAAAEA
jgi:hypothetical protein